jgi:hypothetical protein
VAAISLRSGGCGIEAPEIKWVALCPLNQPQLGLARLAFHLRLGQCVYYKNRDMSAFVSTQIFSLGFPALLYTSTLLLAPSHPEALRR